MRKMAQVGNLSVKAYAGTTGVLLAMNIEPAKREGLLGFALERLAKATGKKEFLTGMLHFPGMPHKPGEPIPTNEAPIQKFRWSDYRVYPDSSLRLYRLPRVRATGNARHQSRSDHRGQDG